MWIELSPEEASLVKDALENYYSLNNCVDKHLDDTVSSIVMQICKTMQGEKGKEAIDSWSVVMTTKSGKRIEFFDLPDAAAERIDEVIESSYKVLWG
jgi:hypothetical protein